MYKTLLVKYFQVTSKNFQVNHQSDGSTLKPLVPKVQWLGASLANKIWSLNFRHSISITHHSSLITHHSLLTTQFFTSVCLHHSISITHYFLHYLGAHACHGAAFFFLFLFSFFQYPETRTQWKKKEKKERNPVKTEPSEEKRKKKKKKPNEDRTQWRRKEKKKKNIQWRPNPVKKK